MNNARDAILQRLRQATRRHGDAALSATTVRQRLAQHPRGPIPPPLPNLLAAFTEKISAASASIEQVNTLGDVGPASLRYLEQHRIEPRLTVAPATALDAITWPAAIEVKRGIASAHDLTTLTLAWAGIAETGTLVALSGPESPGLLNFLPDNHLCVLREADIVAQMEDVWDRLRHTQTPMPRMLNFISGPSRTADVEQTIQLGAHGPRRLHVIIVAAEG